MNATEINEIVKTQRAHFMGGGTLNIKERKRYLLALKAELRKNTDKIAQALHADLGKSASESYMCETGLCLSEISYLLKHLKKFTAKQKVKTPMSQWIAGSFRLPTPYGTVLIMSPWNYPLLLSLEPLVDAIAAGNTVVLKPSAYSPATTDVLAEILEAVFPQKLVAVIKGGRQENACLLDIDFDYIFFTGSKSVGKLVYEKAASRMTPVTLELGGKSPCIVDETAKLPLAAKRIVFGKYLNCGQTCVAPDYILCHESVKDAFIAEVKKQIVKQFGEDPLQNPAYGKMISRKHFERVRGLIDQSKVVHGGQCDEESCRIAPTVMDGVNGEDAVMGEEIFGPIMPVLTYTDLNAVVDQINAQDSPLAFYIFSTNKKHEEYVLRRVRFGGGCINDVIMHLATSNLPFGGFRHSGLGAYHGKFGFDTFTHYKSIIDKKNIIDLPMRYQPYKKKYDNMVKFFLK